MTAIVDYGVGNLFSLRSSFGFIGEEASVTRDADAIAAADRVVLPGVGAFGDAAEKLRQSGLDAAVKQAAASGKPLLGICLGMQLLFERSFEYGEHTGLGLLGGEVVPMRGAIPENLRIPHIGWNALHFERQHPIFKYVSEGEHVYFVHSYYAANCGESLVATADYGLPLTAAAAAGNVVGCQFHPEKSGEVGMKILRGFCEMR
ncbi:MAG: imidazole glycerol phosphate synthase subunit HisH [Oscillospiraceae bacterium]|nr:imidazole glycerol phosphate synthase subunit HisH [Oscillospiraceae bacterium]